MKRISIVSAILLISIMVFSQNEANTWVFTTNTGLSFDTDPPTVFDVPIPASFATSCISDENGDLILYTNGHTVWNNTGQTLMNGVDIGGNQGCSQTSLVVPDPSRSNSFYIFTIDKDFETAGDDYNGFAYSRVNMSGNGGDGSVTEKGVILIDEAMEYVTGVKHANGTDFWVIAHGQNNNFFYVFDITSSDGLNATNPRINKVGSDHLGLNTKQGILKASPDGKYIANTQNEGVLELFRFDNETGTMDFFSSTDLPDAYGVEFDAESKYLYVTRTPWQASPANPSQLIQYDLSKTDPLDDSYLIKNNNTPGDTAIATLQIGPDRKIYCAMYKDLSVNRGEHVGVIHNPSRPQDKCNFNRLNNASNPGIYVGGKKLIAGLPNFVSSFLDVPYFKYDSICFENTVTFDVVNKDNIDDVVWNFNDPESAANSATGMTTTHVFSDTGTYNVSVQVSFNGSTYNYSEPVVVNPLPVIDFSDTIYVFPGAIAPLEVENIYESYLWHDGSTSNIYLASDPGEYTVTVTDALGCWDRKTVTILPANIYFPNAFTPNSDGLNDKFGPKGANSGLFNIRMFIYNRMGQLMYESPVLETLGDDTGAFDWDGTKGGEMQPTGTYVWVVKFDVEKEKGTFETEQYSGSVTLLR